MSAVGTAVATDINSGKARGRKDNTGQEAAIKMAPFKEALPDGVGMYKKFQESKEAFSDWCKAMAEKTGLNTPTVRKVTAAEATETFAEAAAKQRTDRHG